MSGTVRDPSFLRGHIQHILDFYHPRCLNTADGGYYNAFRDDGGIADAATQHLVSTTRFVVNFSAGFLLTGRAAYREAAAHGLRKLADDFRDAAHDGYFWTLDRRAPRDASKQCYGHAFVLLAMAMATKAGVPGAPGGLAATFDLLEARFWSGRDRLYAEEFAPDWSPLSGYRGQNCNMHMTEAMLAAFEATGEARHLERAETLAQRVCVDLAGQSGGLVWEHYHRDWRVDWHYNEADPANLFRPFGFLPGHFMEWAKLLVVLERHRPRDWMLPRAVALFDAAVAQGADLAHGGLRYAIAPDGRCLDADKYYWVHCEAIAAAACLAARTGQERYWQSYDAFWTYSLRHLVDRERGGWYRLTSADGRRHDDLKSPPGKTDYHGLMAAWEVLRAIGG